MVDPFFHTSAQLPLFTRRHRRPHPPSAIISFLLAFDRSSFSAQSADPSRPSNAGLRVCSRRLGTRCHLRRFTTAFLSSGPRRCILFSVLILSLSLLRRRYSSPLPVVCTPHAARRAASLCCRLPSVVALLALLPTPAAPSTASRHLHHPLRLVRCVEPPANPGAASSFHRRPPVAAPTTTRRRPSSALLPCY